MPTPRRTCVCNRWRDEKLGKWRAWYSAFTSCSKPKDTVPLCNNASQQCGTKSGGPGYSQAGRGTGLLYAESDDGITWYKPSLGLVDWKGSKDNNLISTDKDMSMTTGIYLDEDAAASERYKIVTGSNGKGRIALSADGIRWNQTKDLEAETHGRWDTPKNVVWDAQVHERSRARARDGLAGGHVSRPLASLRVLADEAVDHVRQIDTHSQRR